MVKNTPKDTGTKTPKDLNKWLQNRAEIIGNTEKQGKFWDKVKKTGLGINKVLKSTSNGGLTIDQDSISYFLEIKGNLEYKKALLYNTLERNEELARKLGYNAKNNRKSIIPWGDIEKNLDKRIAEYDSLTTLGNKISLDKKLEYNDPKLINEEGFTTKTLVLKDFFGLSKLKYKLFDNSGNEIKLNNNGEFKIKAKDNLGNEKDFTVKGVKLNDNGEVILDKLTFDPDNIETKDDLKFSVQAEYKLENSDPKEKQLRLKGIAKIFHKKELSFKLKDFSKVDIQTIDATKAELEEGKYKNNPYLDMYSYDIEKMYKNYKNYQRRITTYIDKLQNYDREENFGTGRVNGSLGKIQNKNKNYQDKKLINGIKELIKKCKIDYAKHNNKNVNYFDDIINNTNYTNFTFGNNSADINNLIQNLNYVMKTIQKESKIVKKAIDINPYTHRQTLNPLESFNPLQYYKSRTTSKNRLYGSDSNYLKILSADELKIDTKETKINGDKIEHGGVFSLASKDKYATIKIKKGSEEKEIKFTGKSIISLLNSLQTKNDIKLPDRINAEQFGYIRYNFTGDLLKKIIENANEKGFHIENFNQEKQRTEKLYIEDGKINYDIFDIDGKKDDKESFVIDTNLLKNVGGNRKLGREIEKTILLFNTVMNYRYKENLKFTTRRFLWSAGETRHMMLGHNPIKKMIGKVNEEFTDRNKDVKFNFDMEPVSLSNGKGETKDYFISFKNNRFFVYDSNKKKLRSGFTLGSFLNKTDSGNRYIFPGEEGKITKVVYTKFLEGVFKNPSSAGKAYYYFDQLSGKTYICSRDPTKNNRAGGIKFEVLKQENLSKIAQDKDIGINKTTQNNMMVETKQKMINGTKEKIKDIFNTEASKMPSSNYGYITKEKISELSKYNPVEVTDTIEEKSLMTNPLIMGSIFKAANKSRYETGTKVLLSGPFSIFYTLYKGGEFATKGGYYGMKKVGVPLAKAAGKGALSLGKGIVNKISKK